MKADVVEGGGGWGGVGGWLLTWAGHKPAPQKLIAQHSRSECSAGRSEVNQLTYCDCSVDPRLSAAGHLPPGGSNLIVPCHLLLLLLLSLRSRLSTSLQGRPNSGLTVCT